MLFTSLNAYTNRSVARPTRQRAYLNGALVEKSAVQVGQALELVQGAQHQLPELIGADDALAAHRVVLDMPPDQLVRAELGGA